MAGTKLNIDPSEFQNLSKQIADAIAAGAQQGAKKSFGGGDLLKEMKSQLDDIGKTEKANAFASQVRNKMLNEGISTQRAEIQILAQQQIAKNNIVKTTAQQTAMEMGLLKLQAMQSGNTDLVDQYDKRIQKSNEFIQTIEKENNEISNTTKLLDKKLKQQEREDALNKQQEEVNEKFKEINDNLKKRIGITDELLDQLRTPEMAKALFADAVIEKLDKAVESFEGFREMGLSAGQAVSAQFKGMSFESMLGLSDTKGVLQGVVEEFGNVNALSSETVNELGKMAHHLGISGQEAMKLNASLSQMGGETSESAAEAMEHTAHLAEAQGIAGSKVFADMAKNTGTMALYSKGGAEGFGKAAIQLHKMGVEIATASQMADGLLNFEDSINKQMEASVLLGREINLDKARELALSGDLEGSTAEVLKNVGGSAEFDKMNVMQKKALAEATGMSVEALQKSIDAQEESNKYTGEGASLADKALGGIMEYGSAAAGFMKQNAELILSGTQFLLDGNLKKAAGFAMETAHWAKEKAHMLWKKAQSALGLGGGAAKAGAGALGAGADMATKATEGAAGAAEKASAIKPGKGGIASTFKDVAEGLKEFASGKVVMGALALIPVGIGLAAMLLGLPAIFLLAIPGIGVGFAMNMKGVAQGLSSLGNAAANPMTWLGILLLAAFGAALIPLTFALSLLAPVIEAFGTVITAVFEGMAVLIGSIADAFVVMFQAFADNWMVLIPVGIGLQILGVGLLALGVASLFAFPGLMLAAAGLALMIPGLTIVNQIAQMNALGSLAESLSALGSAGPGLALVGASLVGIAGGLSLMALSGLMALPIIGALIGLAAVAPALSGLMGGGGKGEEDKMQVIADKLDQLIAVASKGGEINMDGRKVGEIVRLGLNTSNVR